MTNTVRQAMAAIVAIGLLSGCTTATTSTHASKVDVSSEAANKLNKPRGLTALFRPRSDNVSLKGDRSKAYLASGQDHFRDQNYGLAEQNFRRAVEVRPDNASAWLGLAASLDQLGRFDHSDRAYKQLNSLKAHNARVLNNMGYSYLLRGDYAKARRTLNRAQEIDPTLEEIQGNIHLLEKTIES